MTSGFSTGLWLTGFQRRMSVVAFERSGSAGKRLAVGKEILERLRAAHLGQPEQGQPKDQQSGCLSHSVHGSRNGLRV